MNNSLMKILALMSCLALLGACSGDNSADNEQPASPAAGAADERARYNTALNMHDFMDLVLEPVAQKFWQSAGWIDDQYEGYYELYPTDDEGWQQVREWAAIIVEAGNAMAVPGRDEFGGPWLTYTRAMSDVGLTAMQAAQEQNEEDLFQSGAQLYSVCNACHQAYNPEMSRFFE